MNILYTFSDLLVCRFVFAFLVGLIVSISIGLLTAVILILICNGEFKYIYALIIQILFILSATVVYLSSATHDANFTVAWSSDYSYRNITLSCGTDLATNQLLPVVMAVIVMVGIVYKQLKWG